MKWKRCLERKMFEFFVLMSWVMTLTKVLCHCYCSNTDTETSTSTAERRTAVIFNSLSHFPFNNVFSSEGSIKIIILWLKMSVECSLCHCRCVRINLHIDIIIINDWKSRLADSTNQFCRWQGTQLVNRTVSDHWFINWKNSAVWQKAYIYFT